MLCEREPDQLYRMGRVGQGKNGGPHLRHLAWTGAMQSGRDCALGQKPGEREAKLKHRRRDNRTLALEAKRNWAFMRGRVCSVGAAQGGMDWGL